MPDAAEPVFTATTERFWQALPEHYRTADARLDWPFKRYLSCILDEYDVVSDLIDRFDYDGTAADTSDLVDPEAADDAWLPWLGQIVGINVPRLTEARSFAAAYGTLALLYPTVDLLAAAAGTYAELATVTATTTGGDISADELRGLISDAAGGWRAGSKASIKAIVRLYLIATKRVRLDTHWLGDTWGIRVISYDAETPDPFVIPGAIERADVTPAGAHLAYENVPGATYDDLAIEFPTVDDLAATGMTYAELAAYVPTY